jgi:PAS domain S-box-containing protein
MELKDKTKEALIKELSEMSQRIVELEKSETKNKKAEEDLRKEREFTEKTINALMDTLFVFDPRTEKAILWNKQFREISGYTDEEITDLKAPNSYYSPEDLEKAAAAINDVLIEGKGTVEISLICKDGRRIPTEYLASVIKDEEGNPKYIISIGRDITERKIAEKAQQDSEERLRKAQQIGKLGFLDWDLVTNKIEWSEETFQIYGFDPQNFEPTIEATVDLVHTDDREFVEKRLKAAIDNKTIYDIEHRIVRPDGKVIYVDVNAEVIRDENENPVRMLGTVVDITERKQSDEKLTKSEHELSSIYDSITDFMTLISTDYRIARVNRIVEKLYGKDLVGKMCYEVYQGRKEICPDCPTRKAIETKKSAFSFQPATEVSPPVDIYAFPILNVEGDVIAVVEHGKDVTKRKQAEEERERLNAELAQKNKELEQIVFVTSHDLRTPLVNIDGYSKQIGRLLKELDIILESDEISQEVKKKIDMIVRQEIPRAEHYITTSVSKMDALLSGLLQISKLGRFEINKEKLDMKRIVSEISDTIRYQVDKAGAKVQLSELPSCTGDENQINQLFSNLIGNALKYLDSNRNGVIRVTGKRESDYSVYCVEDNGIGISPDHQEKIFEIFYQLKPKKSTGEGLGLTIVKKIVDIHHGKVWLESKFGTGSKFYVSLPKA